MNLDTRGTELDILRRRPIEHAAQVHAVGKAVLPEAARVGMLFGRLDLGDIPRCKDAHANIPGDRVNDYPIGTALQPEVRHVVNCHMGRRVALAVQLVDQRRDVDIAHGDRPPALVQDSIRTSVAVCILASACCTMKAILLNSPPNA